MKTIALVVCLPKEIKAAIFLKILIVGIKLALTFIKAKNVVITVSESEYDQNTNTVDTAINVSWE